jgi:hypothetical protein
VEDWPDPDPGAEATTLVASVVPTFRRVLALAAEAGEAVPPATVELSDDPVAVSHELSALAPLGPLDSLGLLAAPSAEARLRMLGELLEDAATVLASRLGGG